MKFLSSLDAQDRRLLLWCVGIAVALAVATGFLLPNGNDNDNPLPSTYLAGQHGARAAYETLLRSNYPIERWERPLSELAATAGPETVVIFAQPFSREPEDIKAVRRIVERGGRVLSTGYWGGFILPGEASDTPREFNFAACKLEPEGLDALAGSGEVWMVPEASWAVGNPAQRVEYSCAGQSGGGRVRLGQGARRLVGQLDAAGKRLAQPRAQSRPAAELRWGRARATTSTGTSRCTGRFAPPGATPPGRRGPCCGLACRCWRCWWCFSFSRRSGPVRDLPPPARATPIEFLEALGSLYRNAGAASTAVSVAWERFRRHSSAALRAAGRARWARPSWQR